MPPVEPAPGNHVGPYVLLERLGTGGMGAVYLGRDTRLQRKVALKRLLAPSKEDDPQHLRILHEARAAARINHSNVATIHDVIEEGPHAYIVMEFVDGETLAARVRRGRLPLDQLLSIARQLTAALTAAHSVGVIHRDLKPSNIQITRAGVVKVLDFGVARATRPILADSTAVTVSGEPDIDATSPRAGTPAYMAPEQMLGVPADLRADLYSLGVILFELATGRRPYDSVDPLDLVQMSESLAPRADEIDPAVPAPLADVVAKALQSDPARRYQSAQEFDDALAAVQRHFHARGRPIWRTWVPVAAVIALVLTALAIRNDAPERAALTPRDIRSIAVLPFVNFSGNPGHEYFVDGMTDALINTLGRISALQVKARTSVMPFKGTRKSFTEIARELKVDAIIEGSAVLVTNNSEHVRVTVNLIDPVSQTQLWSDVLERDLQGILTIYGDIARTIAESINVALTHDERQRLTAAGSVDPQTYKLYLLGRHEWTGRTVPQLQRALEYFRQAVERSPQYAPAHAGLADTYVLLAGDFGALPREQGAAEAMASASRALALDPNLAEAHTSLAFTNFFLLWNWAAAEQHFKRALELNPSYATAHHWYGNYLSDIGREDEALVEIRRALDLDPLSSIISRDVAWPLFFSRRYDEALSQLDETLAAFPGYLPAERLRARALAQRGDHAEAVRQFELQKTRSDTPRTRCELAWAYALAGRRREALNELRSAQAQTAGIYAYDVALVFAALNQRDEAFAALERAFRDRDPTMVNLKHDPRFDPLRSDPRYARLVAQMRFPLP